MSKQKMKVSRDPHVLYEASVQSIEVEVGFIDATFQEFRGRLPSSLREDFCGTAALAAAFAGQRETNHAWGVDLHLPTLEWGRREHVERLPPAARRRVELRNEDVRDVRLPAVDVAVAFNYSYWVFQRRADLVDYFRSVREGIAPGGLFLIDAFGGTDAMKDLKEKRHVKGQTAPDGTPLRAFTYVWEQTRFNPADNTFLCYISFKLADGTRLRRIFSYDWRFYTVPELRDILLDAGYGAVHVYTDGWDEAEEEGDGNYERVTRFEQWAGWLAYLVAEA